MISETLLAAAKLQVEVDTSTADRRVRGIGVTKETIAIGVAANTAARAAPATTNEGRTEGMIAGMINLATTSRVTSNRLTSNRDPEGTMTVLTARITPAICSNESMSEMTVPVGMARIEGTRYVTTKAVREHEHRIVMGAKTEGAIAPPTATVVALGTIPEVVRPGRVETMDAVNSAVETHAGPNLT